jgi:outer membrane receptor for ferrienterochelin and colicins
LSTVYGLSGIPIPLRTNRNCKGPASLYGSEAGGLINIITKNPKMQLAFQLMHLPPIGELNLDLGFKGNVGKSISTNRRELFNYSNPIDNNNDNFTDVTYKNAFCFSKMEFQSKKQ